MELDDILNSMDANWEFWKVELNDLPKEDYHKFFDTMVKRRIEGLHGKELIDFYKSIKEHTDLIDLWLIANANDFSKNIKPNDLYALCSVMDAAIRRTIISSYIETHTIKFEDFPKLYAITTEYGDAIQTILLAMKCFSENKHKLPRAVILRLFYNIFKETGGILYANEALEAYFDSFVTDETSKRLVDAVKKFYFNKKELMPYKEFKQLLEQQDDLELLCISSFIGGAIYKKRVCFKEGLRYYKELENQLDDFTGVQLAIYEFAKFAKPRDSYKAIKLIDEIYKTNNEKARKLDEIVDFSKFSGYSFGKFSLVSLAMWGIILGAPALVNPHVIKESLDFYLIASTILLGTGFISDALLSFFYPSYKKLKRSF